MTQEYSNQNSTSNSILQPTSESPMDVLSSRNKKGIVIDLVKFQNTSPYEKVIRHIFKRTDFGRLSRQFISRKFQDHYDQVGWRSRDLT